MHVSEYKLTDLLSSAGATIGIIISGTIFLQFMSTKTIDLFGRYRDMTGEYRGVESSQARHGPLQSQLRAYRRRLRLMNWAARLAAVAQLCFLLALLAGGVSILFPPVRVMKTIGTVGLFAGLILMGCAVGMELAETTLSVHDIGEEIADLDESVTGKAG